MREELTKYWLNLSAAAFVVIACIWVVCTSNAPGLKGQPAPDLAFKMLDGSPDVSLRSLRGRPVVLDFWQSWCGACRHSLPHLEALAAKYGNKVVFIAVNSGDEELPTQLSLRDQLRLTMPMAANGRHAAGLFDVQLLPTVVVIDKKGNVVESFASGNPAPRLESTLVSILSK